MLAERGFRRVFRDKARVRLVAATLRDLSYVAANLRPDDREEVACQLEDWSPGLLACISLQDHAYIVEINGNPEAAVGASEVRKGLWTAWSWGTRRMWRAVPTITGFVRNVMIPDIIAKGGHRAEARALARNFSAHRWLEKMGATRRCELPGYGMGGEDFILFDWTRADLHVHSGIVQQAETAAGSGGGLDAAD